MSKSRQSHVTKSEDELRDYVNNVVRPQEPQPTLETVPIGDPTLAITPRNAMTPTYQSTSPSKSRRSSSAKWWHEHLLELIMLGVLGPLLGYLAVTVFSLNREVGELRTQLNNVQSQTDKAVDGLERRLDRCEDRFLSPPASPPSAKK